MIPFIDLKKQQSRIRSNLEDRINTVLDHGKYIMGPEVGELEGQLAGYSNIKHGVGCASGTDALLLALMSMGIGPGDAVITSPFTFIATAEVISLIGARPVFVDINEQTYNMDPGKLAGALEISQSESLLPKAIIGVDIFGQTADYDAINSFAQQHGLMVVEDAAQSFGAEYKGRKACSLADIACTSFFPAKPLGCYGDGGMCFTNSDNLADIMQSLRVHGKGTDKYDNVRIGVNGRLDTIQASILLTKAEIFPEEIDLRQEVANRYQSLLQNKDVTIPFVPEGYKSAWAQYSILARNNQHRSELQAKLKEAGIPTAIYYPKPLHLQTAFSSLNYKAGDFPVSEDIANRIFSLPMHPYLSEEDQIKIAQAMH